MVALGTAAQRLVPVKEPEDVGALRRLVGQLARQYGAGEAEAGRVELVATELGTNLLRHAQPPRYVLVQPLGSQVGQGLEILAVDGGPGIADFDGLLARATTERPPEALVAEWPRSGLGCGLAAVRRQARLFDGYSILGLGTVVLARFLFGPSVVSGFRWGATSLPKLQGDANGDAWAIRASENDCSVLLVDGLGHGREAARAAEAAIAAFRDCPTDVEACLQAAHISMRGTRGGVASVCTIDMRAERLRFAGVGNVEGRIHKASGSVGLAPRNGTLGVTLTAPKLDVRDLAWEPGATLILYSDGLRSHFDLARYPDLRRHDPAVIASVLHRELQRGRDDATVVVVQDTRKPIVTAS
jgi:anti-sigma regulatory factor (Ser/Thr protein kinase)